MSLKKHQLEGAEWLKNHPRGYLADAPRVGKTRTLLYAAALSGVKKPLVVAPAIVLTHWQREAEALGLFPDGLHAYSYNIITDGGNAMMKELFREGIDALILDEAHYLKNVTSKRTVQLLGQNGYARRLGVVWPASGTPIPKSAVEAWTILSTLWPDLMLSHGFRTMEQFREHFGVVKMVRARGGEWKPKVIGTKNEEELKGIFAEVMLRRTLADLGTDVPELDWQVIVVDGKPLDDGTEEVLADGIQGNPYRTDVARARHEVGDAKALAAAKMIREQLESGLEKVVVFAYHRSVMYAIQNELDEFGVVSIDGDIPQFVRDVALMNFQTDPAIRVIVIQNKVGETGIRLDAADAVVLIEPSWTAADNTQMANRIVDVDRPGRKCTVQMVALANTIDEGVVAQNAREVRMEHAVLG